MAEWTSSSVLQLGFLGFMAGTASRKNRELGGRPPGRKNDKTLEREAQLPTMYHAA
jgi:hypothetical protein